MATVINLFVLQQPAELFLRMSAGSVPVECVLSVDELIRTSKRSSLCPRKLHEVIASSTSNVIIIIYVGLD